MGLLMVCFFSADDIGCRNKNALREIDSLNTYVKKERLEHQGKCPNQEVEKNKQTSSKFKEARKQEDKIRMKN